MINKTYKKLASITLVVLLVFISLPLLNPTYATINETFNFQAKLTNVNGTNVSDGTYNFRFSIYDASTSGNCLWTAKGTIPGSGACTFAAGSPGTDLVALTVTNGLLNTQLGTTAGSLRSFEDVSASLAQFSNNSLYLDIQIYNGSSWETFGSRKLLEAVPYAFRSKYSDNAGTSTNVPISGLTLAGGNNSINNGNYNQTWNWALTSASQTGLLLSENTASVSSGTPSILGVNTLASSTAIPIYIQNIGGALSFRVDDQGSDTSPFVVDASGKVGIGTDTPAAFLHIKSGGGVNSGINLEATSAASYGVIDFNTSSGLAGQFLATGASFSNGIFTGDQIALASYINTGSTTLVAGGTSGYINFATGGYLAANERMRIIANGNVGIGDTSPASLFTVGNGDLFQVNSSGNIVKINNVTTSFPGSQGAANSLLLNDGSGNLSWVTSLPTGMTIPINKLAAATGTNTIDNTLYAQTWNWNSLTTETALSLGSSSISSGTLLNLSSTSTAAAGNTQKVLNISTSGANGTSTQTTYGAYVSNTHTGTSSTNIGGYFTASGGSTNYPIYIGDSSPPSGSSAGLKIGDMTAASGSLFEAISIGTQSGAGTAGTGIFINTISNAGSSRNYGIKLQGITGGSTIANYGISIGSVTGTDGTSYGLYIGSVSGSAGSFGIYSSSGTNYFSGNVGIGDTSPASALTVGNGDLFQVNSSGNIVASGLTAMGAIVSTTSGQLTSVTSSSGNFLRHNGTTWVASTIQSGDIPTGSGNYIQNQSASAQTSSNFWISGMAGIANGDLGGGGTIRFRKADNSGWDGAIYQTNGNILTTRVGAANYSYIADTNGLNLSSFDFANGNFWFHSNADDNTVRANFLAYRSRSSSTAPSAGFGTTLQASLEGFSNNSWVTASQISTVWENNQTNDTTDRDSAILFSTVLDNSFSEKVRITSAGNLGIGDTSPASALTVGSGDKFQVDSNGNIVKLNNVTTSFPSSQGGASTYLKNNGSGVLTWDVVSGSTPFNNLTLAAGTNTIDNTNYAQQWDWSTLSTQTALKITGNGLTTGNVFNIASSTTAASASGDLVKFEMSGNSANVTGNVLKVGLTGGTSTTATALNVTSAATGITFRVNDDGTYTDSTPFAIDTSGNTTIGSTTFTSLFNVGSSAQFQVNSSGNIVASGLTANGAIVSAASGQLTSVTGSSTNYLRHNGTTWVASTIQSGDIPSLSTLYIQNQYASAQTGDIWISGNLKLGSTAGQGLVFTPGGGVLTVGGMSQNGKLSLLDSSAVEKVSITSNAGVASFISNGLVVANSSCGYSYSGLCVSKSVSGTNTSISVVDTTATLDNQGVQGFYSKAISGAANTNVGYSLTSIRGDVSNTLADTSVNTITVYGGYFLSTQTPSVDAGTRNGYAVYASASGNSNGTSTGYGVYANAAGADTNWAIYADNGNSYFRNNIGIGDTTPASALTVGNADLFQVNSSGNIVKINNVTTSFPGSQGGANTVFVNDGSGNLSWATALTGVTIPISKLAVAAATNTIDNTNYAQQWDWSTLSTQNALTLTGNGISTGNLLRLTSTSTALTSSSLLNILATGDPASSWTGALAKIEYTTSTDVDINGDALRVGITGAGAGQGTALNITSAQTGTNALIFRVNDDGTYTDSTPFVVDKAGNVGIGDASPLGLLTVGSGDLFQVSSSGNVTLNSANTTQTTTSSIVSLNGNSLTSGTGLYAASSTLSSGKLVDIQVSGTAATSNTQTALNILTAGANGTTTQTTYGAVISNTHTGTLSSNVGASFSASGGTASNTAIFASATGSSNNAAIFNTGDVSIRNGITNIANSNDVLNINKELGDNATATWSTGTSSGVVRGYYQAVLYNGKIYVWGGAGSGYYTSIQIYDIAKSTWSSGTSGGTGRYNHTAVVYNGKIYYWGGSNGSELNTLDIYDIATDSWSTGATGGTARSEHTAVLYNGKIYYWGGAGPKNSLDIYDIAGNSWTTGTTGGTARYQHTSFLYNGKIYSWGGTTNTTDFLNSVDIYDIASNSWTTGTTGGTGRRAHSSVIYNGKIYSFGGFNGTYLTSVDIYDIANSSWSTGVSGGTGKQKSSGILYNGKAYIYGGYGGIGYLDSLDIYDIGYHQSILSVQENGQDTFTFQSNSQIFLSSGRLSIMGGNFQIGTTTDSGYKFDVSGSTRFAGNMINTSGVNATSDQESLITNTGFEVNDDTTTTVADGWTKFTVSGSGGTASVSSTKIQGSNSQSVVLAANTDGVGFYSPCIPITGGNTYSLYIFARDLTTASNTNSLTLRLGTYTSAANCSSRTSPTNYDAVTNGTVTNAFAQYGGNVNPAATQFWGRVEVQFDTPTTADTFYADSVRLTVSSLAAGVDLAENFPIEDGYTVDAGDIVSVSSTNSDSGIKYIKKSSGEFDNSVIGIVSTKPGITLDDGNTYAKAKVALAGRVPVKISSLSEAIKAGDYITSSSEEGKAMKATRTGQVIGKALNDWDPLNPTDKIIVLIDNSYYYHRDVEFAAFTDRLNALQNTVNGQNQTINTTTQLLNTTLNSNSTSTTGPTLSGGFESLDLSKLTNLLSKFSIETDGSLTFNSKTKFNNSLSVDNFVTKKISSENSDILIELNETLSKNKLLIANKAGVELFSIDYKGNAKFSKDVTINGDLYVDGKVAGKSVFESKWIEISPKSEESIKHNLGEIPRSINILRATESDCESKNGEMDCTNVTNEGFGNKEMYFYKNLDKSSLKVVNALSDKIFVKVFVTK